MGVAGDVGEELTNLTQIARALAQHITKDRTFENGQFNIELVGDLGKPPKELVTDTVRLLVLGGEKYYPVGYGVKSIPSTAWEGLAKLGSVSRTESYRLGLSREKLLERLGEIETEIDELKKKKTKTDKTSGEFLENTVGLVRALRERAEVVEEIRRIATNMRVKGADIDAHLSEINRIARELSIKMDGSVNPSIENHKEKMRKVVEHSWPIDLRDIKPLLYAVNNIGKEEEKLEKLKKLETFTNAYLDIEERNLGRDHLTGMSRRVANLIDAFEIECECYQNCIQNLHQQCIQDRLLVFVGDKLDTLGKQVGGIRKKINALEELAAETSLEERFELLYEIAKLRSALLKSVYDLYNETWKLSKDKRREKKYGYILDELSRIFLGFASVTPDKEMKLWEGVLGDFGRELKKTRKLRYLKKKIKAYNAHLKSAGPLETEIKREYVGSRGVWKGEIKTLKTELETAINNLKEDAPILGYCLTTANRELQLHSQHKLRRRLHEDARVYITPEKMAEALYLAVNVSEKSEITHLQDRLVSCNEKIGVLFEKIGVDFWNWARNYEHIYGEQTLFDTVWSDIMHKKTEKTIRVRYEPRVMDGVRGVMLSSEVIPELFVPFTGRPSTEVINSANILHGVKDQAIGDKVPLEWLDASLEAYGKGRYARFVDFVSNNLEEHSKTHEKLVKNENDLLILVSLASRRLLNGFTTADFGESPPMILGGENTFEQIMRTRVLKDKYKYDLLSLEAEKFCMVGLVSCVLDEVHRRINSSIADGLNTISKRLDRMREDVADA